MSKSDSLESKPSAVDRLKKLSQTIALGSIYGWTQLLVFEQFFDRVRTDVQANPQRTIPESMKYVFKNGVYRGWEANMLNTFIKQAYRNTIIVHSLPSSWAQESPYTDALAKALLLGTAEAAFTTPAKQLKTVMMTQDKQKPFAQIWTELGIKECYKRGIGIVGTQYTAYWGLYGIQHAFYTQELRNYNQSPIITIPQQIMISILEGFTTTIATNPLDMTRTSIQKEGSTYNAGVLATVKTLWNEIGLKAMFSKGVLPRIITCTLATFGNNLVRDFMTKNGHSTTYIPQPSSSFPSSSTQDETPLDASDFVNEFHAPWRSWCHQVGRPLSRHSDVAFVQTAETDTLATSPTPIWQRFVHTLENTPSTSFTEALLSQTQPDGMVFYTPR